MVQWTSCFNISYGMLLKYPFSYFTLHWHVTWFILTYSNTADIPAPFHLLLLFLFMHTQNLIKSHCSFGWRKISWDNFGILITVVYVKFFYYTPQWYQCHQKYVCRAVKVMYRYSHDEYAVCLTRVSGIREIQDECFIAICMTFIDGKFSFLHGSCIVGRTRI